LQTLSLATDVADFARLHAFRAAGGNLDLNLVNVDNVLEGLVGTGDYLNRDLKRYRFGLTKNVNPVLVTSRGAGQPKEITERV